MSENTHNRSLVASLCSKSALASPARAGALGSPLSCPTTRRRRGYESLSSAGKVNCPASSPASSDPVGRSGETRRTFRRERAAWALFVGLLWCACAGVLPVFGGEVVGSRPLVLNAGPNVITAPFARAPHYRGGVQTVTSNTVALAQPGAWSNNQFAPRHGFTQSILLVTRDQSENPGCEGDWWPVLAHTNGIFTVNPRGADLSSVLSPGDQIELRPLTTFRDLFGGPEAFALHTSTAPSSPSVGADWIAFLRSGVNPLAVELGDKFYFVDSVGEGNGWHRNGVRLGDGSGATITLDPGTPILVHRAGEQPLALLTSGAVHTGRLTYYLQPGVNFIGAPYPIGLPLEVSGLRGDIWMDDLNLVPEPGVDDHLRLLNGRHMGLSLVFHGGGLVPSGWYGRSGPVGNLRLEPGKGFVVFLSGVDQRVVRVSSPIPELKP
jgi:hypothetical protein